MKRLHEWDLPGPSALRLSLAEGLDVVASNSLGEIVEVKDGEVELRSIAASSGRIEALVETSTRSSTED